jgi:hypothetical protein
MTTCDVMIPMLKARILELEAQAATMSIELANYAATVAQFRDERKGETLQIRCVGGEKLGPSYSKTAYTIRSLYRLKAEHLSPLYEIGPLGCGQSHTFEEIVVESRHYTYRVVCTTDSGD